MIVATCPMIDSRPHEIFNTACDCGCQVEFVENGNMLINHQAHDPEQVEEWGVFEQE